MRIKTQLASLVLMLSAGLFLGSCGDDTPEPNGGGDTPETPGGGGDEPGGNELTPEEEAFQQVNFVQSEVHATNGFAAVVGIVLEGDVLEGVADWGVAASVNRENMELRPEQWIRDIATKETNGISNTMYMTLQGLYGEETYYCRPYIKSAEGSMKWGDIMQFTTPKQQFFPDQATRTTISVMEGTARISTKRVDAALESLYGTVETQLVDISLEKQQCSISYYETEPGGVSHHTLQWTDDNTLQVGFTYLPPGAVVTFKVAIMCDGEQKFLSPTYAITSKQIPTSGMVDLELAVHWAACNLGASSPWDIGTYHTYDEAVALDKADDNWQLPSEANITQLVNRCEFIPVSMDNMRRGMLVMGRINSIYLPFGETSEDHISDNGYHTGYYWTSDQYYDGGAVHDQSRAWTLRLSGMSESEEQRVSRVELMKKYGLNVRPVCPRE